MNKILKLIILAVLILIGVSVFYSLVIAPSTSRKALDKCLEEAVPERSGRGISVFSDTRLTYDDCFKKYPQK